MTGEITFEPDISASFPIRPLLVNGMIAGGLLLGSEQSQPSVSQGVPIFVKQMEQGSAHSVQPTLTAPLYFEASANAGTNQIQPIQAKTETLFAGQNAPSMRGVAKRMFLLMELGDGWQGPDSLSATKETIADAFVILRRLSAEFPDDPAPKIGLDSDGFIVVSWKFENLIGNLSIFGDGTFSYFVEKGHSVARDGEARIASPLPRELINILIA